MVGDHLLVDYMAAGVADVGPDARVGGQGAAPDDAGLDDRPRAVADHADRLAAVHKVADKAALYLARRYARVTIVVNRDSLTASMSQYLIDRVLTGVAAPARPATARTRLPYETAVDGMFAAGDIRAGSMKRVVAAVGSACCASC